MDQIKNLNKFNINNNYWSKLIISNKIQKNINTKLLF